MPTAPAADTNDSNPSPPDSVRRLAERLADESYRYEFFQAVRLLQRQVAFSAEERPARPVGEDYSPGEELARFSTLASHSFPPGEISRFEIPEPDEDRAGPPKIEVSFLGLIGPAGALPQHYTQTILDRQRHKDFSLKRFFDLFNHRIISLFYRAWEKYHVPAILESHRTDATSGGADPFTYALLCLVGLGTEGTRDRLELSDQVFLHYSGKFAQCPRSAVALERMVSDFLGEPVTLEQFQGQWLPLDALDQTQLVGGGLGRDANNRLGETAIAGERVWSVDTRFRIRLGPLSYRAFCRLVPGGDRLVPLSQFVRTYAGPELDFDLQPILKKEEVPPCELDGQATVPPRLGYNTWACSLPKDRDADDAVFLAQGAPSR